MIGVYGGTFDPVHFGHLRPALDLMQDLKLDEIRFVPCHVPPHRGSPYASPKQRLAMLRLALRGEPGLVIDERELKREGPSYSVDTLTSLRAEVHARPVVLIIGMDALHSLNHWYRWKELGKLSHIVVTSRPGWQAPEQGEVAEWLEDHLTDDPSELHGRPAGRVLLHEVTRLDISASRIRAVLATGLSPRYLLPEVVLDYIQTVGLYR